MRNDDGYYYVVKFQRIFNTGESWSTNRLERGADDEEQDEYNRIRRLHPQADEMLLRALRDDLEDRFPSASANGSNGRGGDWQQLLGKWDDALCPTRCNLPRKKVSLPWTSTLN